jgi:TatD DNase family protein
LIDTHAHIDTEAFDKDRPDVINSAFDSGIEAIIIPATEPAEFHKLLQVTSSNERLYCSIGVHPHNAQQTDEHTLQLVEDLCSNEKVVAIGEIGLDYYYDFSPPEIQKHIFREQLKIAKKLKLPVIIHNRDSDDDLMQILREEQDGTLEGVLHCFSSTTDLMRQAVDLGFHISYTGSITFKNSKLNETILHTPLERMLLETDSPYMTPVPHRGKRNEPKFVRIIAEKISEIKSLPIEKVISMTTSNARNLFKLVILIFSILLSTAALYAAEAIPDADNEPSPNPFPKFIGFGPYFGTNTVVETYYKVQGEDDISYEGLFSYGGCITYYPADFVHLEAAYIYSKNNKVTNSGPTVYNFMELSSMLSPNPYGVINFYGIAGLSYNYVTYDKGGFYDRSNYRFGLLTGLGIIGNINLKKAGVLNIVLEWRLNFLLSRTNSVYYEKFVSPGSPENIVKESPVSSFYSIPRFGILWYPPFLKL